MYRMTAVFIVAFFAMQFVASAQQYNPPQHADSSIIYDDIIMQCANAQRLFYTPLPRPDGNDTLINNYFLTVDTSYRSYY